MTGISATSGVTGSTLIITGTNFGTDINAVQVRFRNGTGPYTNATVISVTNTQITITVPAFKRANVMVKIASQLEITGPAYFNTTPYTSSSYSVELYSQQEVDDFIANNKGVKAININGGLTISGSDITSVSGLNNIMSVSLEININAPLLSSIPFLNNFTSIYRLSLINTAIPILQLDNLKTVPDYITINSLPNLTKVSFSNLTDIGGIDVGLCPLLTDLNIENLQTVSGTFSVRSIALNSLTINKLVSIKYGLSLNNLPNLKSVSAASLTTVSDYLLRDCVTLNTLNFSALKSVIGHFEINNLPIKDLTAFKSIQVLGGVNISNNPNFNSFAGLENITALTASTNYSYTIFPTNIVALQYGLVIINNPALTSLVGLQNLKKFQQVTIIGNTTLNDLCPLKAPLLALNSNPIFNLYSGGSSNSPEIIYLIVLKNNGNLITQQNALDALNACK